MKDDDFDILVGFFRRKNEIRVSKETKIHCIKLLGDKLSARNFNSQVNEIHARLTSYRPTEAALTGEGSD